VASGNFIQRDVIFGSSRQYFSLATPGPLGLEPFCVITTGAGIMKHRQPRPPSGNRFRWFACGLGGCEQTMSRAGTGELFCRTMPATAATGCSGIQFGFRPRIVLNVGTFNTSWAARIPGTVRFVTGCPGHRWFEAFAVSGGQTADDSSRSNGDHWRA